MRTQKGMSLVETMVSLAILGFGLVASVKMQVNLSVADELARQRTEATQLARNKAEELRGANHAAAVVAKTCAVADDDTATAEAADCETTATVADRSKDATTGINLASTKFYRSWTIAAATATEPAKVTVTVTWEDLRKRDATVVAKDNKVEITTAL